MTPKLGAGASMGYSSYNLYIPNNVKGKFSLQIILTYMSVLIKFIFRCASISCTDDRMSLTDSVLETVDWQSLMFDSYFTIRLV